MAAKMLIIGDSITVGLNASDSSLSYASRLADLTGFETGVNASSGRTVQENIQDWNAANSLYHILFSPTPQQQQYNTVPAPVKGEHLLIRMGINDAIQKPGSSTSSITFKSVYKACLNQLFQKGWTPEMISIINIGAYRGSNAEISAAVEDYNVVIKEICEELGIQLIDLKAYEQQRDISAWYSDEVHPNDLGHLEHARFIASSLQAPVPSGSPELLIKHGRLTINTA